MIALACFEKVCAEAARPAFRRGAAGFLRRAVGLGVLGMGMGGIVGVGEASEYVVDGEPTAREEEVRWLLNRGRFDSAKENSTWGTTYTDILGRNGPMAPHQSLSRAAHRHSEDMAAKNVMQHATVNGSAYYNAVTQPSPWDRMFAEGYNWTRAGENVAGGYATAEAVYVGWWKSEGHRRNMYNPELREIGTGYAFSSASTYDHYATMSLGASGGAAFFTDTLFRDADANGRYTQGEGVEGIVITLSTAGGPHAPWDRSSSVGSFAVPLQGLLAGAVVRVGFRNESAAAVTLNLPRDYSAQYDLTLAPGESREFGSFTRPLDGRNVGLRDLALVAAPVPDPGLVLAVVAGDIQLSWKSAAGWRYRPQRSVDLEAWTNLTAEAVDGTGATLNHTDAGGAAQGTGYYRLITEAGNP
jgi:hypothetical protein